MCLSPCSATTLEPTASESLRFLVGKDSIWDAGFCEQENYYWGQEVGRRIRAGWTADADEGFDERIGDLWDKRYGVGDGEW